MLFNGIGCIFLARNRMHNRNKMYKSAEFAFSSHIHLISESCQDIFCFSGKQDSDIIQYE